MPSARHAVSRAAWIAARLRANARAALTRVIRLLAVEQALQGVEMALRGRRIVAGAAADFPPGLLDHGLGQLLERLPGPHRVDLHLGDPLHVIEAVIGL